MRAALAIAPVFALGVAVALAATACVKEPSEFVPDGCVIDSECGDDRQCRGGACFDKMTGAQFAADLRAPQTRTDMLSRAEIQHLGISETNQIDVMFVPSVQVSGRVVLHTGDEQSVAAKVEFRRPSRIVGAPDYVVTVTSQAGKLAGQPAFLARLVPTTATETYAVTITPDGTGTTDPLAPSALAPPTQLPPRQLTGDTDLGAITLDAGGLRAITGQVVDAVGEPMVGMTVQARNQRTLTTPYELISSTGITDAAGKFVIYLPLGRASFFDLLVNPGPTMSRPSLKRHDVTTPSAPAGSTSTVDIIRYPALPAPVTFQLPVEGPDAAGGLKAAVGAKVTFSTVLATGTDEVIYEAESQVVAGGAEVKLIPGVLSQNRSYKVTVIPLSNAQQGATWDAIVLANAVGGVLTKLVLPKRISVSGTILDASGKAAAGMAVSPHLSLGFIADATANNTLARTDSVLLPEVTTDPNGHFVMYLDPKVVGQNARYDLELVPPSASPLPRWSADEVEVAEGLDKVEIGTVMLPDATLVSGVVKDESGVPVAGADVHVYMTDEDSSISRQRAQATSDALGNVSLVLPAP